MTSFVGLKRQPGVAEPLGLNIAYICESTAARMGRADAAPREEVAVRVVASRWQLHKRLKYIGTVPECASLSASIVVFYDSVGGHVRVSGLDPYRMLADIGLLKVTGLIPARVQG